MTDRHPKLSTPWGLTQTTAPGARDGSFEAWTGRTVATPWPAAYGGDLSVGVLAAAVRSAAAGQLPHSMQIAFLLPGDRDRTLSYVVERGRDGFRYANRSVRLLQSNREIAAATVLLRAPRPGEAPAANVPGVEGLPDPESLPTAAEAIAARGPLSAAAGDPAPLDTYWAEARALDTRHIDPPLYGETVQPRSTNRVWVRFTGSEPAQRELLATPEGRIALVAYIADDTILEPAAAALGHGWLAPGMFSTTVQQNIWFHSDFSPSDWLLFSQRLVSTTGDHVVCQGEIVTRDGALVATVIQEGIVRVRPAASESRSAS